MPSKFNGNYAVLLIYIVLHEFTHFDKVVENHPFLYHSILTEYGIKKNNGRFIYKTKTA